MPASPELLGRVREYTEGYKAGNKESFNSFADLAALLLGCTVAADDDSVRIWRLQGGREKAFLAPISGPTNPLRLQDGRFLKITVNLEMINTEEHGARMKVPDCSFQYQLDEDGEDWVFRYDYKRDPTDHHPPAHLHVRGELRANALYGGQTLERIHFPVARPTLEGVIRLLSDQFYVPTQTEPDTWRPVLHEAEKLFLEIAHRPTSGPAT